MRGVLWLGLALWTVGCATTPISRTLMIPLQSTEPGAVAPNPEYAASAYGSISALPIPIDLNSATAQRSDTGDQIAGVQPDLGGMIRVAEHVLVGGNLYGSPSSAAVHATPNELRIGEQLLFGFRTRIGFAGELDNGVGLITTFGWGFDVLPYADTLSGTTSQVAIGSTLSSAITFRAGIARFWLGPSLSSQPTLTKNTTTCTGCGTSVDYDLQILLSGGARVQVAPSAALHFGVTMPLVRDRIAWMPVFTLGFSFDFTRPKSDPETAPAPPPPPRLYEQTPPPPPPPL
ncbi:MAG: hypothetical protein QM723_37540 [Myxococcaceae bacterium]